MVTSPVSIPYATQVTLTAVSPTNDTLIWYATDTSSTELIVGASFTTPVLYHDTTYWVEAVTGGVSAAGMFLITEQCHFKTTTGAPVGGWPSWLLADDYIEITGPPNADLGGITLQQWSTSAMQGTHTFPPGTLLSPDGIAIVAVGQLGSSQPSPANFYYHGNGTYTGSYGSSTAAGRILKDASGTIIDAVGYGNFNFPAAANVSASEWSNPVTSSTGVSTSGFRLIGPDLNTGANWVVSSAIHPQDPYTLNSGVPQPKGLGCASARVPVQILVANPASCDVGVSQILQPTTAVNLGSSNVVSVRVENYGTAAQSNIPVSYQIGNQPVVTETITASIASSGSLTYNFTTTANLSNAGNTYHFKAWTGLACDSTPQNDTAWKSVTNLIPNYCISTATSAAYEDITNVTLHTLNNSSMPVGSMYTNFTATVPPPVLSPGVTYPISITSDFVNSTFNYNCWVKVWIDFDRDGTLDPVSELVFSSATQSSNTVTGNVTIPVTALPGNTLMRVVFVETSSAASVNPCGTYTWGETEDYMVSISPGSACDAGILSIVSPKGVMPTGATLPVEVVVMNFGSDPIAANTLEIAYEFNNGAPVTYLYPNAMQPYQVDTVLLPTTVTTVIGSNSICVYTILACDTVSFNDEKCGSVYGIFTTTIPYFDDFETVNYWYKPDASTNWQYGTPSGTLINSAHSGTKAWVTNLSGDYSNSADEYLYTPLINFQGLTGLDTVTLSFAHFVATHTGDYGRVQYSTNGGQSFSTLGFFGDNMGTNWYNTTSGGLHYFSHTNSGWMTSSYKLNPNTFNGQSQVQFRFNFSSNPSGTSEGWAIDDFSLSLPMAGNDVGVIAIHNPGVSTAAGNQVTANVTIRNFGSNAQTSIPLELRVGGNLIHTETWTGNLASLDTVNYTFVLPFTAPAANYNLCIRTNLLNDAYPSNDELCRAMTADPAIHDVGVNLIVDPQPDASGNICHYNATNHSWYQYPVIVEVTNYGQNTQTSIPIDYTFMNGGTVHQHTWTGTLSAGQTTQVQLPNLFLPNLGVQQLCVETTLPGDPIATNNKSCKTYTGVLCIGIDGPDPDGFLLMQNIPNPASYTTLIGYRIPAAGKVKFGVVNLIGQELHAEQMNMPAGTHQLEFDVSSLADGIYYYFVEYNGQRLTLKMVIRK